jgi:SAM-dependent methyltransferase
VTDDASSARKLYDELTDDLLYHPAVGRSTMMGRPCVRRAGRFFASFDPEADCLVLKLPAQRVEALIDDGTGEPFAPNGRVFREWVTIPAPHPSAWARVLAEALDFAGPAQQQTRRRYDEDLADRMREVLGDLGVGIREQKMFGGLAFLVNGHMAVAASGEGGLLVGVSKAFRNPGGHRGPQRRRAGRSARADQVRLPHGRRSDCRRRAGRRAGQPGPDPAVSGAGSSLPALTRMVDALRDLDTADPDTIKACCAAAYGFDLVGLFLGDSYHPGGADLTRRLADTLDLRPGERVLDVAAGIGTTALLLTTERSVEVVGVDLGDAQIARARARATDAGLDGRLRFEVGDAERLPVGDAGFDVVVCECAFCTFPDKATAAAELARVLRPGGRVGITDVWLDPTRLDPDLRGLAGRVACLADARPIDELHAIITRAGLVVSHVERHDRALADTIDRITTRLRALRLVDLPILRRYNLDRGIELARRAAAVVERGDAGYLLLTATKP